MTIELQQHLDREMKDALAIADSAERRDAILTAMARQSSALIECQRKTSDRVKQVVADLAEIKPELKECVAAKREYRNEQQQRKGAAKLFEALKWIAAAGGGGLLVKILTGVAA